MSLAVADHPTVNALLRSDVELTLAGMRKFLKKERWIGKTNRYSSNVVDRLRVDHPLNNLRKRNLAQYIAASTVLHVNDGWSYLGRSMACLLDGDAHRALHLAYYAELRAAMSLLSGAGYGIFKRRHFVISGVNTTARLHSSSPTHEFAWSALEYWGQQQSSGILFAETIRPEGRTLDDWFHSHGGAASLSAQARGWFMQWGMDLRYASKDRDARNESSYRPDGIPDAWSNDPGKAYEFVQDAWRSLEPGSLSGFEEIDRYILRQALERHYKGISGSEPDSRSAAFTRLVEGTVAAQNFSPAAEKLWVSFLLRKSAPDDPSIFAHSAIKPGNDPTDCLAIASRAILLLRLATGSANGLLKAAGINSTQLAFWWRAVGEARGLWDPHAPPVTLSDLWADISEAFAEIRPTLPSPQYFSSVRDLNTAVGEYRAALCTHERVGLWAVCPT